jgi:hypothetical protein
VSNILVTPAKLIANDVLNTCQHFAFLITIYPKTARAKTGVQGQLG